MRFSCAARAMAGSSLRIVAQSPPSTARETAQAMAVAPAIATSDLCVGLDASATASIKALRWRAGSRQPSGETRMAAPLVRPLFSSCATGVPFFRAFSAILEVGPRTFLLKASKASAQRRILAPMVSALISPSWLIIASASASAMEVSSVNAARPK